MGRTGSKEARAIARGSVADGNRDGLHEIGEPNETGGTSGNDGGKRSIRTWLFKEPIFALLAICFLATLASLLLARALDGWSLAASYAGILVLAATFIAWRLRYPGDPIDGSLGREGDGADEAESCLADGIERYIRDVSYRFDIDESDSRKWHKRGLNFIFDEAASTPLLKKELIRNVAHEIRTPLASIQLVAEGIEDGIFEADDEGAISQISESVKRMAVTVEMMSAYASNGAPDLRPCRSDLSRAMTEAYSRACAAAAKRGDIAVSLKGVPDDGKIGGQGGDDVLLAPQSQEQQSNAESGATDGAPLLVNFPRTSLDALFSSLIDNAFEHASGMSSLTLSLAREHNPLIGKQMARVSVRDDGCGVPSGDSHRMTEPFWKSDASRVLDAGSEKKASPGLGLAIAKEMVVRAGGSLDVQSEEERGTCVSVWLPLCA